MGARGKQTNQWKWYRNPLSTLKNPDLSVHECPELQNGEVLSGNIRYTYLVLTLFPRILHFCPSEEYDMEQDGSLIWPSNSHLHSSALLSINYHVFLFLVLEIEGWMILKNFPHHCRLHAKVKLDTDYCLSLGNSGIQEGQYNRSYCSLAPGSVFCTVFASFCQMEYLVW